ncbi:PilN domain-containing protein [Gemmatimonas phototrophica]|uniref:GspL periplasmic domain-containing protein n=1 Tax=Gemmatimonas phototrophica TaxID=1379270 RepID=A0A143BIY8_9BACT|nr:PilN domain-containing protein [Gemmatimonas phototrophica]AMW04541.1 hypothetical protein GEMMAAP_06160 [Gemmatimonas phototrophica]
MSRRWALMLTSDQVRVYAAGTVTPVAVVPWQSDAPEAAVRTLAALPHQPTQLVLVVGLAWLEAVPLTLPPVPLAQQRRMLQLDADRWFPFAAPPAVAIADGVALAMPADTLTTWVRSFATIAPVDAVVALPQAAQLAGVDGTVHTTAASGETGVMEFRQGTLRQVRRLRQSPPANATVLDDSLCATALLNAGALPLDWQLLDPALERRMLARRQGAWWRAAGIGVAAIAFCLWSADQWRERALAEGNAQREALAIRAQPALDADARRQRAQRERQLLTEGTTHPRISEVLALLGERLPADVFVQRAEWDGSRWRLDGSARDAASLVPLLAGLPGVGDVRSLAPSTRFLDGGQPRSSFSLSFALAASPTGQTP